MERVLRPPPFQIRSSLQFRSLASSSGLQDFPFPAFQHYIRSPERVQLVRCMKGLLEFDHPSKQTESKVEVTGKISSHK